MSTSLLLSAERFPHLVGAEFRDAKAAVMAAKRMIERERFARDQIDILRPGAPGRKLEPEPHGVAGSIIETHVALGVFGLFSGIATAVVLFGLGSPLATTNPIYAATAMAFFGAIAGLLTAGLASIRPGHDRVIDRALATLRRGGAYLIVHVRNRAQERRAMRVLKPLSEGLAATL